MKTIFGLIALLIGIAIFGWIGYEMSIKGVRALTVAVMPGIAAAAAMCFCGAKWMNTSSSTE